jgi:undecaprenyl-diphosphatase
MSETHHGLLVGRITRLELPLCLALNRASRRASLRGTFGVVSRLGDGRFWYVLGCLMVLLRGAEALPVVLRMTASGITCLLVYDLLKGRTARPRPLTLDDGFLLSMPPLDRYSFPSGHTMHAVCFTVVAVAYYPVLAWALVPFTALVALSRLVLGLHYPSDLLAGGLIGAGVAAAVVCV